MLVNDFLAHVVGERFEERRINPRICDVNRTTMDHDSHAHGAEADASGGAVDVPTEGSSLRASGVTSIVSFAACCGSVVGSSAISSSAEERGVGCCLWGGTRTWGTTKDVGCFVNH